jgi:hypothetical protein
VPATAWRPLSPRTPRLLRQPGRCLTHSRPQAISAPADQNGMSSSAVMLAAGVGAWSSPLAVRSGPARNCTASAMLSTPARGSVARFVLTPIEAPVDRDAAAVRHVARGVLALGSPHDDVEVVGLVGPLADGGLLGRPAVRRAVHEALARHPPDLGDNRAIAPSLRASGRRRRDTRRPAPPDERFLSPRRLVGGSCGSGGDLVLVEEADDQLGDLLAVRRRGEVPGVE